MNIFFPIYIFFSLFIISIFHEVPFNKINIKINSNNNKILYKSPFTTINSNKNNFFNNKEIRKLEEEKNNTINNNIDKKNDNSTSVNSSIKNEENQKNDKKSGIGWLGIVIIIILSIVVVYVLFVGCRYYRRKKYQNPSFYYKITEEMFDDITPIE